MMGPRMIPSRSGGLGHWNSFIMMPMPMNTAITGSASQVVQLMTAARMEMGMNTPPISG